MTRDLCTWGLFHLHHAFGGVRIGWQIWLFRHGCGADDFNDLIAPQ